MLIIISQSHFFAGESWLINKLFASGMPLLHLRKPNAHEHELDTLIQSIDERYRSQLALHQHGHIAEKHGIYRHHLPEKQREREMKKQENALYSTSIHRLKDYEKLDTSFAYALLSPVFDSISKQGYGAMGTDNHPWQIRERPIPLIALGGITPTNMEQAFQMGFDGVASLGYVWQHADPCKALEALLKRMA